MRRIKRAKDFQITVDVLSDQFIKTPRGTQREWLVQRAMAELARDLQSLHELSPNLIAGGEQRPLEGSLETGEPKHDNGQLKIRDQAVMEEWQRPLMIAMADTVARQEARVLEVGFGLGLAATRIQENGVRSHTVIECNPGVAEKFMEWRSSYPNKEINLLLGRWQDHVDELATYDGILFDTYPLTQNEFVQTVLEDVAYAEHFFETASRHLVPGGAFTYFTGEYDSLSRAHQRLLLRRFSEVSIRVLTGLRPQMDSQIWWAPTMAIVKALK